MSAALYVSYPRAGDSRFDRDYYVATHLPLVERAWGPFGLSAADAFFPTSDSAQAVAVAVLTFANDAAIDTALASPETPAVLADVANFTDIVPIVARGVVL